MILPERRQLNPSKVRAAREAAGITTAVAAAAAELTSVAYYRWENIQKGPLRRFDAQRAGLLAIRLNKTLDDLTDPLDIAPTHPQGFQVGAAIGTESAQATPVAQVVG